MIRQSNMAGWGRLGEIPPVENGRFFMRSAGTLKNIWSLPDMPRSYRLREINSGGRCGGEAPPLRGVGRNEVRPRGETSPLIKYNQRFLGFLGLFCWALVFVVSAYPQSDGTPAGDRSMEVALPLWRRALGGPVAGFPSAQAGTVMVVSEGGSLRSFVSDGSALWIYQGRGNLDPFVSRSREGTSYISQKGIFKAINRTGRELWNRDLGEDLIAPALIGWDGRLFVFSRGKVSAFTASGCPLWSKKIAKSPVLRPRLDIQGGILTALEGQLLRIDPYGDFFSRPLGSFPRAAVSLQFQSNAAGLEGPASQKASLDFFEDGRFLVFYKNGTLELMDSRGKTLGQSGGGSVPLVSLPSPPIDAVARDNKIAVLLRDGKVLLLSDYGAKILWDKESHIVPGELGDAGDITGEEWAFFFDERGIYFLTRSGAAAFSPDGRRLWHIELQGAASVPAFSEEGILYSGGQNWIFYAYKLEDRVLPLKQSLYGPAPEGVYGLGTFMPSRTETNFLDDQLIDRELRRIAQTMEKGQVGSQEPSFAAYLMGVAGSLLRWSRPDSRPAARISHRIEAAKLLAYIGSRETAPFLTELFLQDPEPLVKAAAAEALGRIGVDPDGLAMGAFTNAVFPPLFIEDEQVLEAIAAATGALCRFSGPPLSSAGTKILTALKGADKARNVRLRAEQELRSLH